MHDGTHGISGKLEKVGANRFFEKNITLKNPHMTIWGNSGNVFFMPGMKQFSLKISDWIK